MAKTLYLNLEDDVTKVVNKLKREQTADVVLVFPKKSFIFSDSINLRLLKKQVDLLGKNVAILTMDDRGKMYAEEAGFELKHLPRTTRRGGLDDIRPRTAPVPESVAAASAAVPEFIEEKQPEPLQPESKPAAKPILKKKKPAKSIVFTGSTAASKSVINPAMGSPVRTNDNVFLPPSSKAQAAPKRKSYRAYVVGFIALALIIALLLLLVVLPSANVIVYAKTQSVARDVDVIADTSAQSAESSRLTIPAVAVNESHTIEDTFQTNGKKEVGSKAEGRVAIYNLTGNAMTLKASTTTLTVGNKSYTFKTDQTNVRPTTASNDPNATVADIIASDGGEDFNVPAGTRVEITNQSFGSQPQRLYAKTVSQVIGGNSRFVSVVSKDDLTDAQNQLTKRVVDGINSNLGGNAKLVDGAYSVNVELFNPDKTEGTEAQNYSVQMKVTITGLAFDESILKNMIRQRLLSSLGSGKELQEMEKDSVIYRIKNLDVQNGLMQLNLHYESNSKPNIEPKDLVNKLAGKSKQEASDLILSNSDVDRVEITLQPAWQSGLPRFGSKIHLEVKE